jgi:hypothetical protein
MLPPFEVKCIASASRRRADPLHCRAASLINVLIVPASFSGSRGGTVIADASNPLNLIVHLCGKISHTKKKVGLCPRGQPAVILYESRIPDIEAGLASADRRIEAARADGAPASSSGSALHPQRHDISGARAALARAHVQQCTSRRLAAAYPNPSAQKASS